MNLIAFIIATLISSVDSTFNAWEFIKSVETF